MKLAFVKFKTGKRGFKPKLSIRSSGQVGFNGGAVLRFNLEKFQFVVLYYDEIEGKIGIEPGNDSTAEGAVKLQIRNTGGAVSARAFFDFFQIDYSKTIKYDASWDDELKMIIVQL